VSAKNVYNEFIADRHHIHMNSTKWLTLTEFVKHLGRTGQCKVDETEKGWFITLIRVSSTASKSGHLLGFGVCMVRAACQVQHTLLSSCLVNVSD
jgi:hypothetical protein